MKTGKRNNTQFRIIVKEARSPRQGKYVESLGWYDPKTTPVTIKLDKEKYDAWVKKGAQPTESVLRLVLSKKEKEKLWPSKKSTKTAKVEEKKEVATEAPAEEVKVEPVTEEKTETVEEVKTETTPVAEPAPAEEKAPEKVEEPVKEAEAPKTEE